VFNISGTELVFLLLAAMVVLGPDRLPGVMRKAGRVYGELRRMANGYEREFKDTFAEPIREFRSAARDIEREVRNFGKVDDAPSPPMRPEKAVIPVQGPNETSPTDEPGVGAVSGDQGSTPGEPGAVIDGEAGLR